MGLFCCNGKLTHFNIQKVYLKGKFLKPSEAGNCVSRKAKFVCIYTKKAYSSRGIVLLILNLALAPLAYGWDSWCPLNGKSGGPKSRCGRFTTTTNTISATTTTVNTTISTITLQPLTPFSPHIHYHHQHHQKHYPTTNIIIVNTTSITTTVTTTTIITIINITTTTTIITTIITTTIKTTAITTIITANKPLPPPPYNY